MLWVFVIVLVVWNIVQEIQLSGLYEDSKEHNEKIAHIWPMAKIREEIRKEIKHGRANEDTVANSRE